MTSPAPVPNPVQVSDDVRSRAWMSALADGDAEAWDAAQRAWQHDPDAREAWHRYHLIGDVLRSSDLAQPASSASTFLDGFRARLAAEPAVLAPAPLPAPPSVAHDDSRRHGALAGIAPVSAPSSRWLVPMAAAAGVLAVAGVVYVSGVTGPGQAPKPVLAEASPANPAAPVLRNAELDEYLRAHRLQRGGVVPLMPGAGLQRAELPLEAAQTPSSSVGDGRR
jgi:sigma-E factor negative regulatory protein RseA